MTTTTLEPGSVAGGEPVVLPLAISADSHVIEPLEAYSAHIDPAFRDRLPRIVHDDIKGDQYVVDGLPAPISIPSVSACGKIPRAVRDAEGRLEYYFTMRSLPIRTLPLPMRERTRLPDTWVR